MECCCAIGYHPIKLQEKFYPLWLSLNFDGLSVRLLSVVITKPS